MERKSQPKAGKKSHSLHGLLEDWERRYNEAEREWQKAKWDRYTAQIIEDRLGEEIVLLRREYRAIKSSNVGGQGHLPAAHGVETKEGVTGG